MTSNKKTRRVKSYRVEGVSHDGKPFDVIENFTPFQTQEITLSAIVHDDGVIEDIANALVTRWNEVAVQQGRGTTYSVVS